MRGKLIMRILLIIPKSDHFQENLFICAVKDSQVEIENGSLRWLHAAKEMFSEQTSPVYGHLCLFGVVGKLRPAIREFYFLSFMSRFICIRTVKNSP